MSIILSIVVPTYNVEKFIGKCASSILSQVTENVEVIFINDCSTDNSEKILFETIEQYPDLSNQIRVIRTSSNSGIAAVRNLGIQLANGDYIYQIDGDDYLEPLVISKYLEILYNKDVDILVFNYFIDYGDKKELTIVSPSSLDDFMRGVLSSRITASIWNKIIKKALIVENNLKFIDGVNYGEDYYWISILLNKANNVIFLDVIGYNYVRYNGNSYTSNIKNEYIDGLFSIFSELEEIFLNYKSDIDYAKKEKIIKNIKFINDYETLKKMKFFLNDVKFHDIGSVDYVFYFILSKIGPFLVLPFCYAYRIILVVYIFLKRYFK